MNSTGRLNGFGLLRELRTNPATKTIPVILLSARAGEESRVEGLEHGADDYLIKPFSARELLARVAAHLHLARVRQEAQREIARSKVFLERLADTTPDLLWVYDILEGKTFTSIDASKPYSDMAFTNFSPFPAT